MLFDCLFRVFNVFDVVHGNSFEVFGPFERGKHFAYLNGITAKVFLCRKGEVCVTCPRREVGAICPPVMPYIALFMKIIVMFSLRRGVNCFSRSDGSQIRRPDM